MTQKRSALHTVPSLKSTFSHWRGRARQQLPAAGNITPGLPAPVLTARGEEQNRRAHRCLSALKSSGFQSSLSREGRGATNGLRALEQSDAALEKPRAKQSHPSDSSCFPAELQECRARWENANKGTAGGTRRNQPSRWIPRQHARSTFPRTSHPHASFHLRPNKGSRPRR